MIDKLQEKMLSMPQSDINTTHSFCDGIYARQITIPKGVAIVGAEHKTSFFLVISQGSCLIVNGDEEFTIRSPQTLVSKVGAKRAILALSNSVITTFHKTDKTDVNEIEKDIIKESQLSISNNPKEALL